MHAWTSCAGRCPSTVVVHRDVDFCKLSDKIKMILHAAGMHATTIQPEFVHRGTAFDVRHASCTLNHRLLRLAAIASRLTQLAMAS
jgi:hypothetical protein